MTIWEGSELIRRLLYVLAVAVLVPALLIGVAGQADASPTFNQIKTSRFSEHPKSGFHTCQHRYVTIPKPASGHYYAWAETFDNQDDGHWTRYNVRYHGKFFWTTCVVYFKNKYYNYGIYSILTLVNSACEQHGKCTTHSLPEHAIKLEQTGKYYWGSQVYAAPLT